MKIARALVLSLFTIAFLGLANIGCETTEGAGKDVEKLGKDIKHSAQDHKP